MRTEFTMGYKMGQKTKPPLHGLNLKKSLIKNCYNIILDWVTIQIKYNYTPQNPTVNATLKSNLATQVSLPLLKKKKSS